MVSRLKWFVPFLLVASFALPVLANDVLLVIVDREHHRAYVPEGSVIPAGMTIRVEALASSGGVRPARREDQPASNPSPAAGAGSNRPSATPCSGTSSASWTRSSSGRP